MKISPSEITNYERILKGKILDILKNRNLSFDEIIKDIEGAYPEDIYNQLNLLMKDSIIFFNEDSFTYQSDKVSAANHNTTLQIQQELSHKHNSFLKFSWLDAHPADYDWRFNPKTILSLEKRILNLNLQQEKIALFGTPTIYAQMYQKIEDLDLFIWSQTIIDELKEFGLSKGLFYHDLFNPINSDKKYSLVLSDPPWYNPFYEAFIVRSSEKLNIGGKMLLSMLPKLTREGANDDIKYILEFTKKCGFKLDNYLINELNYQIPAFEKLDLIGKGININEWRNGDLAIFTKISECKEKIIVTRPKDEPIWKDFVYGQKKIKLRIKSERESNNILRVSYANGKQSFLGSVSRRNTYRKYIDLWTSDNAAFTIKGLHILEMIINDILQKRLNIDQVIREYESKFNIDEVSKCILHDFFISLKKDINE